MANMHPTLYMLIGLPGSGKSTWRDAFMQKHANRNTVIISSDDLIEIFARERGLTYSEAFKTVNLREIETKAFLLFHEAITDGRNIIIDRTNMSKSSRARFLNEIPKTYRRIAILFNVEPKELQRRLDARGELTGKTIPPFVMDNMRKSYEEPSLAEFDEIVKV